MRRSRGSQPAEDALVESAPSSPEPAPIRAGLRTVLTWLPILLGIIVFSATSCEDRAEKAPSAETASSAPAKPGAPAAAAGYDATITGNAERMMEEGQQTFRFDTFGSEAFFGDAERVNLFGTG